MIGFGNKIEVMDICCQRPGGFFVVLHVVKENSRLQ